MVNKIKLLRIKETQPYMAALIFELAKKKLIWLKSKGATGINVKELKKINSLLSSLDLCKGISCEEEDTKQIINVLERIQEVVY